MTLELLERLRARATELGFARFGVAHAERLEREGDALDRWIAEGHHASMGWMRETAAVRADPTHPRMLAGARSVIALATPYARADGPSGPAPGIVARYARGRDYHNVLRKRAQKLAVLLREAGYAARVSVDAMPVLERAWAQRAGLGFIGKNSCLIVPGLGSHLFLSAIVTDAELPPDEPMAERCGSCRLCLDACPTDAFVRERELASERCISYLTIEHHGSIDEALRPAMGAHLFGCDDCQDICPYNRTAPPNESATAPFAPHPRLNVPLEALLEMDEASFAEWARGSPLSRPRLEGLARNAALVLGNKGEKRHLPILERTASSHASEVVREAASWAATRIVER